MNVCVELLLLLLPAMNSDMAHRFHLIWRERIRVCFIQSFLMNIGSFADLCKEVWVVWFVITCATHSSRSQWQNRRAVGMLPPVMNRSKLTFAWNLIVHQCQFIIDVCLPFWCLASIEYFDWHVYGLIHAISLTHNDIHDRNINKTIDYGASESKWKKKSTFSRPIIYDKMLQ